MPISIELHLGSKQHLSAKLFVRIIQKWWVILLAQGANPKQPANETYYPIFLTAKQNQIEMVKLLIAYGTDIKRAYSNCKKIIKKGANINKATTSPFEKGYTPRYRAIQEGHTRIVQLLLEYGAYILL